MKKTELIKQANIIGKKYGLCAEIVGDVKSTGVQGDQRTRTFVIMLSGKFPGYEALEKVSNELTNTLPINRVIFEVARKK